MSLVVRESIPYTLDLNEENKRKNKEKVSENKVF